MEMDHKEKLILKIPEDIETQPIEVNVQSAGVSEEEQVFFSSSLKTITKQKRKMGA